ncbi:MAG: META domain-containing protein [Rhodospirillales bacterium]|nr:META domain-containing protein [Rhodospirillales bacterium]
MSPTSGEHDLDCGARTYESEATRRWVRGAIVGAVLVGGCAASGASDAGRESAATEPIVRLDCIGRQSIELAFSDATARLTDPRGRVVLLSQRPSGSGIRYEGEGHLVRGKGDMVTWTAPGSSPIECREVAALPTSIMDPKALAGTRWQLVQFESSDDAIGTIRPSDPTRYTLEFDSDRAAFRLDCNRANAGWRATPTGTSGGGFSFAFGGMTRVFCDPQSMDTRIAGDLPRVRSFTIDGDTLNFALELDSGIYTWRRLP